MQAAQPTESPIVWLRTTWRPSPGRLPSRRRPRNGSGSGAPPDRQARSRSAPSHSMFAPPNRNGRPPSVEPRPGAGDERVGESLGRANRGRTGRGGDEEGGGHSGQRQDRSRRAHPGIIRHGARTGSEQVVGGCGCPHDPCRRRFGESRSAIRAAAVRGRHVRRRRGRPPRDHDEDVPADAQQAQRERSSALVDRASGTAARPEHEPVPLGRAGEQRPSYVGGCSFAPRAARRFSYRWNARCGDADAHVSSGSPSSPCARGRRSSTAVADRRTAVTCSSRVEFPEALAGDTATVAAGYAPTVLPGVRLAPAFFSRIGNDVQLYPSRWAFADYLALDVGAAHVSLYSVSRGPLFPVQLGFLHLGCARAVLGLVVLPRPRVPDVDQARRDAGRARRSHSRRRYGGAVDPRVSSRQRHRRVPVAAEQARRAA